MCYQLYSIIPLKIENINKIIKNISNKIQGFLSKIKRSKTIDLNPLYEIELVELPYHFTLKTHFQYLHLDPHQQHNNLP